MEKPTRTCVYCAADISHRTFRALSCERCRADGKRGARALVPPRERVVLALLVYTCVVCSASFTPRASAQLACSPECRYLRHKFQDRAPEAYAHDLGPRTCEVCAVTFKPSSRAAVTCGRRCARLRWARQHPMATRQRRLHLKVTGHVRARDWRKLVARHDGRCAYCSKRAPLTKDHVVPISRGGRHTIGNLLPACRSCNSRKHNRTLTEWRLASR